MLQLKLRGLLVEPLDGFADPKTGGRLTSVEKVYHLRVYTPLPLGSVAFTQTLYVLEYARLDSERVFVPFVAPEPLLVCPLLHWIVHENVSPSGSLIEMLQLKLKGLLLEPFDGEGVPKTGGRLVFVVKVYHFLL